MPRHARHVGQGEQSKRQPNRASDNRKALKFLPEGTDVPWQRVVSSSGKISSRGPGTTGAQHQREALEAEDVEVRVTSEGEFTLNWVENGWFPERVNLNLNNSSVDSVGTNANDGDNGSGDIIVGTGDAEGNTENGERQSHD